MRALIVLNDPPYGGERTYNGVRLALALLKAGTAVVLFLMGDAVAAAKAGQTTPEGYYNLERMLARVILAEGRVLLCGTCMSARGLGEADVVEGAAKSTMDALALEIAAAERVLIF